MSRNHVLLARRRRLSRRRYFESWAWRALITPTWISMEVLRLCVNKLTISSHFNKPYLEMA